MIFFRPHILIIITVSLSFMAWLVPDFNYFFKGIYQYFPLLSIGFALALIWYFLAISASFIGYEIGLSFTIKKQKFLDRLQLTNDFVFKSLSFLAFLGVMAVFIKVFGAAGGFSGIIKLISTAQVGLLKKYLYDGYSPGIYSLRYLAIHASIISIYRYWKFNKLQKIDILNYIVLFLVALVSSRLSLIMVFISSAYLYINENRIKISKTKILLILVFGFHALSFFNYSRNGGYYAEKGLGFYSSSLSQILSYLATPFQGAMSIGENYEKINDNFRNFLQLAHIDLSLQTNSAFQFMFLDYRFWSIPIMIIMLLFWSFLFGFLQQFKSTPLVLSSFAILYSFAEFWRLNWFGEGIMITLLIVPLILSFLAYFFSGIKPISWKIHT